MNTLDQLEEELKSAPDLDSGIHGTFLTPRQGLVLIDLIRKKDEALEEVRGWVGHIEGEIIIDEALALTENLK